MTTTSSTAPLADARRVGAAPRHLDRVAAFRAGLAGQAGADSLGLRRDRARARRLRAGRDSLPLRAGLRERAARSSRATPCARTTSACTWCPTIAPGCATARRPAWSIRQGRSRCSTGRSTPGRSTPTGAWTRRSAARSRSIAQLPRVEPTRPDNGAPMVLEGGGIETNGAGLLLVTEEWLLSGVQVRNPGLTREGYEQAFGEWLGARKTIWLGEGCAGDDTHGHVDDIARFVAPDTIVLAVEEDPADENHARSMDNVRRLELGRARSAGRAAEDRAAAVSAPRADERRASAGQLRQLLHRQRGGAGADVQRSERSRGAERPGGADAASPDRRHSRRRSGLGPRHDSLPDAAGAAGVAEPPRSSALSSASRSPCARRR